MKIEVGDRVTIEVIVGYVGNEGFVFDGYGLVGDREVGGVCAWPIKNIKSVEPAQPGVGDTVTWGSIKGEWRVIGVDGDCIWVRCDNRREFIFTDDSSFRIVKRAPK